MTETVDTAVFITLAICFGWDEIVPVTTPAAVVCVAAVFFFVIFVYPELVEQQLVDSQSNLCWKGEESWRLTHCSLRWWRILRQICRSGHCWRHFGCHDEARRWESNEWGDGWDKVSSRREVEYGEDGVREEQWQEGAGRIGR